jgi:hypothetical protein
MDKRAANTTEHTERGERVLYVLISSLLFVIIGLITVALTA